MSKRGIQKSSEPELVKAGELIPPGTKQVRINRTETFSEPLSPDPGDSAMPGTEEGAVEEFEFIDELPEQIEPSPFDQFISSFQQDEDVVIYVRRRPDPPGVTFRTPYAGPVITVGDLPFDSSLDSATALDIAIQRIYGGGHYLLEFKRGGKYAGAKTRYIADPVERPFSNAHETEDRSPAHAPSPIPARRALDEVKESIEIVQSVYALMNPRQRHDAPTIAAPPANPVDDARSTLSMLKELKELLPEPAASGEGWGPAIFGFLGKVVTELRLGEIAGPALVALASRGAPPVGAPVPGSAPPPPTGTQSNGEVVPPFVLPLLNQIVPDIFRDADTIPSVHSTIALLHHAQQLGHGAAAQNYVGARILSRSPFEVAQWLASINPAWSALLYLEHGARWIETYQDNLREAIQQAMAASNGNGEQTDAPDMSEILDAAGPIVESEDARVSPAATMEDGLNVACPKCNSPAGEWCNGVTNALHKERVDAITEANEAE